MEDFLDTIYYFFGFLGVVCGLITICMTFYLGRTRIKAVDLVVHGYEIPSDSIFYQLIRLPNYAGAFAWQWSAKRNRLLHVREHFDKKFQRPFIFTFWVLVIFGFSFIVVALLDERLLHIR